MTGESLLYSEEAEALRSSVRAMLAQHCTWQDVLARTESDDTAEHVWRRLAGDLGCVGLPWAEAAVVAEELGRTVADVPYLTSGVIATHLVEALDDPSYAALTEGGQIAALTVPWASPVGEFLGDISLVGDLVHGTVRLVAGALGAAVLLVPVGDSLVAVDAASASIEPAVSFDMTRPLADVTFDGSPSRLVASGPQVAEALVRAGHIGVAMLAAEQLGLAERALEMSVAYAKERRQFGRAIGSYQANKHRLADIWVRVVEAKAVARHAAACAAGDLADLPVAASLAKLVCSQLAVDAAGELIQIHGGIGITWEHPAHLYLKRARADAFALGAGSWHRGELARRLDLASR
ncbi:MAG: acyl-CoA dehydrogenase family protein [Aeromicrobium sp.]